MTFKVITNTGSVKETGIATSNGGYGTAFPSSPSDSMEFTLTDSVGTPTYAWRFRYNSGSSNTDKWEFVGGNSPVILVANNESRSTNSYGALTTAGPSFTCPRAGQYTVGIGYTRTTGTANLTYMSFDIGGTGAVDSNSAQSQGDQRSGATRFVQITVASASTTLTAKYRCDNTTSSNWSDRWMQVLPIRLS
jgi:hypothetical protein